jgi:uncharacterized membrane protein YdjX (TVP38/TMEM64 family)
MKTRVLLWSGLMVLGFAAAVTVAVLAKSEMKPILAWVAAWRGAASVPFILFYAFAALVLLPDSLLTIAAGAIFGLAKGLVLVSIGSMLGAAAAFFLGRSFARNWVRRRTERWPKFRALDRAISRHGFWVVFLTRLSPIIPYGLLNYAYGITTVRVRDYLLASWIGMLPGSLLYVYAGTAAATLAAVISGRAPMGRDDDVLLWLGLVATIAVIGLLTYFARRELARELRS